MLIEIIGFLITIFALVYIYFKYVIFDFWRKRGVFYVEPVVPIGNVTNMLTGEVSLGECFQNVYMKYKDHRLIGIYTFYKPGLVIADLDLVRTVLTKEFGSFHDRGLYYNEKVDPLSGHLFLLPGKKWRNLRVKMSPTFTSGKIKQMFQIVKEIGEEFQEALKNETRTQDAVDIKDIFGRYLTDVIMSVAFGMKSNCLVEGNNEIRYWGKKAFEQQSFWVTLSTFAPIILQYLSIPHHPRGVIKFFPKLFEDNVQYRRINNVVRHDFMNLLIQLMDKGYVEPDDDNKVIVQESSNTNKLTMSEASAQAFVFFIAGFETSSNAGMYGLYELAQHQDIQDKIRQEIHEMLKKHDGLTYDAVNEMTYLHKVVQETLRKYPPIPVLNRICTKDILLPKTNVHLPKGISVTVPVLGIHRDPSIYPDPEKFDPERFSPEQVTARHPYAYLPFGEGPRVCIAERFANVQTKVGMICILSKFKIKLHPQTPVPLVFDESSFVLQPKSRVRFIMQPL